MQARTCNHEGCAGAPVTHDMCRRHYQAWLVAQPVLILRAPTRQAILAALPGTQAQIIARTGLASQTVKRAIARLRVDEEMFIGKWRTPKGTGEKFAPIFHVGKGVDAEMTERKRKNHHRRNVRAAHAKRVDRKNNLGKLRAVTKASGWAAALMVGM